jgi:hypothetical protein
MFVPFFSIRDDDVRNVSMLLASYVSKNDEEKRTQQERLLELMLRHSFDFLLVMLVSIENKKNYAYASTDRIELTMCNKLVVIFFYLP